MSDRPNRAPEIRHALTDVRRVCDALGLTADGGKTVVKQARGLIVRCVWHQENTPSMSVRLMPDGTIGAKCFGCDRGGDVLALIAGARGLSLTGPGFRDVLVEGARLGGLWQVVDELEGRGDAPAPRPIARTQPAQAAPLRDYPPSGEVESLWARTGPADEDPAVSAYLWSRGLVPDLVDGGDLGRAVPTEGPMPRWARCRLGDWREAGYRLLVPMYDAGGKLRSLRGWRVTAGEGPKRLPPFGHLASGLVMANSFALAMLRGTRSAEIVVVAEGEPDWMTWCLRVNDPHTAVIGIVSGSWGQPFADRLTVGAKVIVRTDHDASGDRYADAIMKSVSRRCFAYRSKEVA